MNWRLILDGLRPYAPLPAFLVILVVSNFFVWVLALWTARMSFRCRLPEVTRELVRDREQQIEQLETKNRALELENGDYRTRLQMAGKALQVDPRLQPVKRRRTG